MKKIHLPTLFRNPSRWGKWLLSASLLLVAILGFFQLYEIQEIFFPGQDYKTEIKLISKEYIIIDKELRKLPAMVYDLQKLRLATGPMCPGLVPSSSSSSTASASALGVPPGLGPGWDDELHAAKKKLVNVVRKLKYLDAKLKSMQLTVERQRSSQDATPVNGKPDMNKTLAQIQEFQARCHLYNDQVIEFSEKINQLAGCRGRQ